MNFGKVLSTGRTEIIFLDDYNKKENLKSFKNFIDTRDCGLNQTQKNNMIYEYNLIREE